MIRSLTSLRFIFALMIFMHHFIWGSDSMFPEGGALAVTFFFILSGFVLAYSYKDRILSGDYSKKTFWLGRMSKLYPLHFLCFGVAFILAWKVMSLELLLIAPVNLALLQSWIPARNIYFSFNAVSWFSSDMLFFYFIFPWLISGLSKMKLQRIGIWCVAILVFYVVLTKLVPVVWYNPVFYINPLMRLLDFMLGIILFLIFENYKQKIWKYKNKWMATFGEVIAIFLLVCFVVFSSAIPEVYRMAIYYWIPVSFIILVFACFNNWGGMFSKVISVRFFQILGEISFSFYMVHQLIIGIIRGIFLRLDIVYTEYVGFIVSLSITLGISMIVYFYIETPVAKWLKFRLRS